MKICDLALFSWSSSSGVRTYITSKMEYVQRRSHLQHVVFVPGPTESVTMQGRSKVVVLRGVRSPYPGVHLALNVVGIARLIERERPDIIELNCQYTLPWAAFLATRQRRTPIVGVYHTDVPACAHHWVRGAGRGVACAVERIVEWYEGLIYRHCTLTILLNQAMESRLNRLGVTRTRCLPCGVDADRFHPRRRSAEFRRLHRIRPEQHVIFYAGRFSPEKELDVLFAAFAQLPRGRFVLMLAGDGPDTRQVAAMASQDESIRYLGHLDSRDELATAYASSDLFVSPGRYETFGMSTIEALCSGVPVVGIAESGTPTVVPSRLGMMTKAGDATAMAAAIRQVTTWDLRSLKTTCHQFAAGRFSWDRVFDQYVGAYRALIDGAPSRDAQSA